LHEEFLSRTLHDFFLATLRAGGAAVTLASSPHREAMVRLLERDGIDVASLRKAGLYTELDVGEVRSYCEVGHAIGSARLDQVVGEAVAAAAQTVRPPTARLMIYGELVAELWSRRNFVDLCTVERWWNQLATRLPFTLVCGYPIREFAEAGTEARLLEIYAMHSTVIPPDSYPTFEMEKRILDAQASVLGSATA
jgi:hypothetical protein